MRASIARKSTRGGCCVCVRVRESRRRRRRWCASSPRVSSPRRPSSSRVCYGERRAGGVPAVLCRLVRLAPASCTVLCTPPTGSPVQVTSPAYEAEQRRCDAPKPSDGGPERLRCRGDRRSRRVAHRFIGRSERAGGDPDSANAVHVRAVDGVRRRYAGADRVIDTITVYGDGCAIVERSASATSIFG